MKVPIKQPIDKKNRYKYTFFPRIWWNSMVSFPIEMHDIKQLYISVPNKYIYCSNKQYTHFDDKNYLFLFFSSKNQLMFN